MSRKCTHTLPYHSGDHGKYLGEIDGIQRSVQLALVDIILLPPCPTLGSSRDSLVGDVMHCRCPSVCGWSLHRI